MSQQQRDDLHALDIHCVMKGSRAVSIGGVHLTSKLQQQPGHLKASLTNG